MRRTVTLTLTLKLVRNIACVVECPTDRLLRLSVFDLWAIRRCMRRPLDSGQGEASSLLIDRPAAN